MSTLKGWIKEKKSVKETEIKERTLFWKPREEKASQALEKDKDINGARCRR